MSSASDPCSVTADLYRNHILPFIWNHRTFINLGYANSQIRSHLKEVILPAVQELIAIHDSKLKEIESEIMVNPEPGLGKNMHFSGVAVSNIDFRTLNYGDADTLFILSVFYKYLTRTTDFPTSEQIQGLLNKKNAVKKLWNIDARSIPEVVIEKVLVLIGKPEWTNSEQRFTQGPEWEIIKWIKLFTRYLTRLYEVDKRRIREDFHWNKQKYLRRIIRNKEKIWVSQE